MVAPIATTSSSSLSRRGGGGAVGTAVSSSSSSSRRGGGTHGLHQHRRPPVIVEINASVMVVGYAGQSRPSFIQPLPSFPSLVSSSADESTTTTTTTTMMSRMKCASVEVWYRYLSRVFQVVFDRLAEDPKGVYVIIVVAGDCPAAAGISPDIMMNKAEPPVVRPFHHALTTLLLRDHQVPGISILSSLAMIPCVFPQLPDMLVLAIYPHLVGSQQQQQQHPAQAECFIHASGQNLPYTYHSVMLSSALMAATTEDDATSSERRKTTTLLPEQWLDSTDPHSLIALLMNCFEACPRPLRKRVIQHLVIASPGGPVWGRHIGRHFRTFLKMKGQHEQRQPQTTEGMMIAVEPPQPHHDENRSSVATTAPLLYTPVSRSVREFHVLADAVRVLDLSAIVRPELWSWMGTSLWAQHWQKQKPPQQTTSSYHDDTTTAAHPEAVSAVGGQQPQHQFQWISR